MTQQEIENNNEVQDENLKEKEHDTNNIPEELIGVLENVPPKDRKIIEETISASFMMQGTNPIESIVSKKITSDHISKYLEGSSKQMELSFKEGRDNKVFIFLIVLLCLIAFIIIIVLLKNNPDVMEKVIYAVGGAVLGLFSGYGFGKYKGSQGE